jgi:tetratricopeptide (TPR) repeat protein
LNKRISDLEQEREAMIMALNQSRDQHTRAMSKIAILEADLRAMTTQAAELRQREADLQRDLETERAVTNEVVEGQRKQLRELETQLEAKTRELAAAHETIAGLQTELQQTRDAFANLRDERDGLLREHAHMSELLKLDEDGRMQLLIEQNMDLAKQLREASERVERLSLQNHAEQDALIHAKRDLAVAKTRIIDLQEERRAQDRRLKELEERLRREDGALAEGQVAVDPAEVEELREIIRRQLRVQERRRQAREILGQAIKDLGAEDERVAAAIKLFDGEEVFLTPEEQRLLADRQVDGEFISPFARDRDTVANATEALNRDLDFFSRAAEKAFVAGHLSTTRGLFQMMVEMNPGHTSALCKLGFVHFRLEEYAAASDTFRRAVELDNTNPYANRMLGESLMKLGDIASAEEPIRRSIELRPEVASSHTLLAEITFQLGRVDEAVEHCLAAIQADPMPSEPYFNLAMLHARKKQFEEAREFYMQALERGALPDPALAEKIYQ